MIPPPTAEALDEQGEWLRVTLSSIGDGVITSDRDGRVTFLNPVAQMLTGWSPADAAGAPLTTVFNIVNEETRRTVENPATRALREGLVVGLANHTLLISRDGTERPIDDCAAPIRNACGDVAGVVLVFRDVTERHTQDRRVRDALTYADNIIATLRIPFLVLDGSLRVVTANGAFYRNFHVSPEETADCLLYDLGGGQWNIPKLRELLGEILPKHNTFDDFRVEHDFPSIGRKVMLLNARRIRKPGDASELILLAIEDITERSRVEAALQVSEMRYRRLFEAAKDGILILDTRSGRITDANPFMSELLGYSHADFLGKALWEIGLFSDKSANEAAVRELQQTGYIRYDHLPLESTGDKKVEVEIVANVYREGEQSVIQCNIRDISERSRLERKLKEQSGALVDLHRRKDEFLAMLSHELRNPLAPISNAVHLLRLQAREDPLQLQARTMIERQLAQMTRLVDDLMEVSRITTGRVHLRQDRVAVAGIVERAVETASPILEQRRHELTVSVPDEPIWLFGDAGRLEQVIVNLLTNAAKYTEEGGRVWLTASQEGDEAVIRVRDTGVGIAPELLPRVFDLFTQAERSLDRAQGGLGIGLALVQRLVEMHRGKVEAFSAMGQGSEFVVRLPILGTPVPLPPSAPKNLPTAGRALRILVVDDNVDSAESLAMLLQTVGHEVQMAHDGPTGLTAALGFRPEAVLLDIGLPKMDGYEVARRMRLAPQLATTPLIALTGYGQESDRQRSREAGFDHHLVKPVDFENLLRILSTVAKSAK